MRRMSQQAMNLFDRRFALDLEDAIDERSLKERHSNRNVVELPLQLGMDQADRRRRWV